MENSIRNLKQTKSFSSIFKRSTMNFKHIPDSITHLILMIEIMTLIILFDADIAGLAKKSNVLEKMQIFNTSEQIIVELCLIIIIQLYFNISLIKITYLRSIHSFDQNNIISYVIIVLTFISLIIDFCQTTTSLIYFRKKYSQAYNQIKIIITIVNIATIITTKINLDSKQLIIIAFYIIVYVIRIKFQMFDFTTNLYSQILILFGMIISIFNAFENYVIDIPIYYKIFGTVIIFSLHSYLKMGILKQNVKIWFCQKDQMKKIGFVKNFIKIIQYFDNDSYNQKQVQHVKYFINQYITIQLPILDIKTKQIYLKSLFQIYSSHKSQYQNSIIYLSLLAQFQMLVSDSIINFIQTINIIQTKMSGNFRSWIQKIELLKLKQFLEFSIEKYKIKYKNNHHEEYMRHSFIQNSLFILTTIKVTESYQRLWSGLRQGIDSRNELNKRIDRIIQTVQHTQKSYSNLKIKSKYSSLIYNYYLRFIHKNKELKRVISLDWQCSKAQTLDPMNYHSQIFICLDINGKILGIGENCVGLLGFKHNELYKFPITKLFPNFMCISNNYVQEYLLSQKQNNLAKVKQESFTFCVDIFNHLKAVNIKLNIHFMNGNLQLMGSIDVNTDVKHIIAFKKTGKIIQTSNFMGQCDTKMIQQDNHQDYDDILHKLQSKNIVQLSIFINYLKITDQYVLQQYISKQQQSQSIYIICNIYHQNYDKTIQVSPTINKTSDFQQNQIITPNKNQKIEQFKQMYIQKYKPYKIVLRFFILFLSSLIILIIIIYFENIVFMRSNQKYTVVDMMKKVQKSTTQVVYIAGLTFQLGTTYKTGVDIASIHMFKQPTLQQYVQNIRYSLKILGNVTQPPPRKQIFSKFTTISKSQLILQTTVSIYQYLLMDMVVNNTSNMFELVQYTKLNFQQVFKNIIPSYEKMILIDMESAFSYYMQIYTIMLIFIVVFTFVHGIVFFGFKIIYEKQTNEAANSLLQIDESEIYLSLYNIEKYKNIIHCNNQKQKFRTFNMNQTQFNNQLQKDGGLFMIAASLQMQNFQLQQQSDSKTPGTPFNPPSHNDYTVKPLNQIHLDLQQDKQKIKTKRKLSNKTGSIFIYILIIVLLCALCVNTSLYYYFSKSTKYTVATFVNSIVALKKPFYSYQIIHTCLLQNIYSDYQQIDLLKESIQSFKNSNDTLKQYDQTIFLDSVFKQFREYKNKVDFQKMCTYIECTQFQDRLNTAFITGVTNDVILTQRIYNHTKISKLHVNDLRKNYHLDYLIYSSKVYIDIFDRLYQKAFNNLINNIQEVKHNSNIRITCSYVITVLILLVDLVLIYEFNKQKKRMLTMIMFLRENKDVQLQF